MKIAGLVRSSLIDFPGRVAAVLFTPGCNLRCPWCHNAALALKPDDLPSSYSPEEVLGFLETRRGLLGGVVISGGEPTLQPGLADYIKKIKALDLAVKLDSNGTRPEVLAELIEEGLLDYVALDVKGPLASYPLLSGIADVPLQAIQRSLEIIANAVGSEKYALKAEFRTTVMEPYLTEAALLQMADWLPQGIHWRLQGFTPRHGTLNPDFVCLSPTEKRLEEMQALVDAARTSSGCESAKS